MSVNREADHRVWRWLPRGSSLDDEAWGARHRAVCALLALHVPGLVLFALLRGHGVATAVLVAAPVLAASVVACWPGGPRLLRAAVAAAGLMVSAALVVYLSGGAIEAHFHFFVVVPLIALYEDWVPFGIGIGFVLVEHGVLGRLWPQHVYDHHQAQQHPWAYAGIHAGYIAAACIGSVVHWRLRETSRGAERRMSAELVHRARYDEVTGLTNRAALIEDAPEVLSSAAEAGQDVAVLVLDLDRFKDVNDTLGHEQGDELLAHVARCLRDRLRDVDRLFRLGGDEFAVILPGVDGEGALAVAGRIRAGLLTEHLTLAGVDVPVDASIGIALGRAHGPDQAAAAMSTLLRQGEVAMYAAKTDQTGVALYDPDQDSNSRGRLALLADLRHAVESDQLVLYYQPKVRLADGAFVGAEALVRWNHPVLGMVPPLDFIPLAEATNLIVPLTHRVIGMAAAQVREWADAGLHVPVAVNVSPRSVIEGDLPRVVHETLAGVGVAPQLLRLEITESTLVNDRQRAMEVLRALNDLGVGISLDDFGTGYSSLSYLKHLPVDELKIDRSFVAGLLSQVEDEVLVRATVDLGHNLGMTVIAEGVENEATADVLRALGCDLGQGYHYARPLRRATWRRGWPRAPPRPRRPWRGPRSAGRRRGRPRRCRAPFPYAERVLRRARDPGAPAGRADRALRRAAGLLWRGPDPAELTAAVGGRLVLVTGASSGDRRGDRAPGRRGRRHRAAGGPPGGRAGAGPGRRSPRPAARRTCCRPTWPTRCRPASWSPGSSTGSACRTSWSTTPGTRSVGRCTTPTTATTTTAGRSRSTTSAGPAAARAAAGHARAGQRAPGERRHRRGRPASPYWSAYTASKSAFEAWLRSVGPEARADGVDWSSIHFGLVHTAMSAPTEAFRNVPGMSAAEAADAVARVLVDRPRVLRPWWATLQALGGEVSPAVTDRVLTRMVRFDTAVAARRRGSRETRR